MTDKGGWGWLLVEIGLAVFATMARIAVSGAIALIVVGLLVGLPLAIAGIELYDLPKQHPDFLLLWALGATASTAIYAIDEFRRDQDKPHA